MENLETTTLSRDFSTLIAGAEATLSNQFGKSIQIGQVEQLSGQDEDSLVLRAVIDKPTADVPAQVIIKRAETEHFNPDDVQAWQVRNFYQDWLGLAFLSTVPAEQVHIPRFYGGNHKHGIVIMEDMGRDHRSLVQPLLEGDAASAEQALLRLFARLGQMHANTIGQAATFDKLLNAIQPKLLLRATAAEEQAWLVEVRARLESVVTPEPGFWQEVEAMETNIATPGPFTAYIHGDPCPDNVFYTGETVRLIDFGRGRFDHVLLDALYPRMMFPSCWCANRLPDDVIMRVETAYRTELAQQCPQAQEDRLFSKAMVEGCAYWLIETLDWQLRNALPTDKPWGISTFRARILARLEAFVAVAEEFGHLPAMRGTASRLIELLMKRWPETEILPLYPAFRG